MATRMQAYVETALEDVQQTPRSKPGFQFPIPSKKPLSIDAPFNEQAARWITIARHGSGDMSREMIATFLAVLREI